MNARRYSYFRQHAPASPSVWPIIAVCALAALDLWLIAFIVRVLWRWV